MNIKKATALLTLTFFLIAVLFGCAKGAEFDNKSNNIAIITKGSDSTFWNDMKNGALSAATEYNVNVTFEGPENEEDYNAQNKMIENAVSNNVGVIILSAIDFEKNADAVQKAINSGIKVITVDSDVDVNGKELFVGTNNIEAGKKAAKQAVDLCKEQKSINIGIVNYGANTENGKGRLKGFTDYINKIDNAKIVDTVNVESTVEAEVPDYRATAPNYYNNVANITRDDLAAVYGELPNPEIDTNKKIDLYCCLNDARHTKWGGKLCNMITKIMSGMGSDANGDGKMLAAMATQIPIRNFIAMSMGVFSPAMAEGLLMMLNDDESSFVGFNKIFWRLGGALTRLPALLKSI